MPDEYVKIEENYLLEIQSYLKKFTEYLYPAPYETMRDIFFFHLGLNDPLEKQGKRIRPLLTLISAAGAGVKENRALPAASAIELIHNFSLIHDDIEDNGTQRRGKPSVWKKWGLAQGLNAGDAMFNAAFMVMGELKKSFSTEIQQEAVSLLSETCSALTKGQYLDISFEQAANVSIDSYFEMIKGKTAALLACSVEMGALLAGLDEEQRHFYRAFGNNLGIAFQIYDDWLGIWGDETETGKSTISDLVEKKRSYPVLLGLQTNVNFKERFLLEEKIDVAVAKDLAMLLENAGVEETLIKTCKDWTDKALASLEKMHCEDASKRHLEFITNKLLMRKR